MLYQKHNLQEKKIIKNKYFQLLSLIPIPGFAQFIINSLQII